MGCSAPGLVLLRPSQRANRFRDALDKRELLKKGFFGNPEVSHSDEQKRCPRSCCHGPTSGCSPRPLWRQFVSLSELFSLLAKRKGSGTAIGVGK